MNYRDEDFFRIFCAGRLIKSHTGRPGFIIITDLTEFTERYANIKLFFDDQGDNSGQRYAPFYFEWVFKGIQDENLFHFYDRILSLREYQRFVGYVHSNKPMSSIDRKYLNKLVEESEEILFTR